MKKLCKLLNKTEDELFNEIFSTFLDKITQWDYFVNWEKVLLNTASIERELNLLNYLIGKKDIHKKTVELLSKYPETIKVIPFLLGIKDNSLKVLVDTRKFIYREFDFAKKNYEKKEIKLLATFILRSGFGKLLRDNKIKNLVDYATGMGVGLDSNARKNRGGSLMENLVEEFVKNVCTELGIEYISQATAKKIKRKWDIDVKVSKSHRRVDFAINKKGKLFFIETNFYNTGGSKLKSTATEYINMNNIWKKQGIKFIWITDGVGWKFTSNPLREYFDKADYLLNLRMLSRGILKRILE